jgi:hypothetical protein
MSPDKKHAPPPERNAPKAHPGPAAQQPLTNPKAHPPNRPAPIAEGGAQKGPKQERHGPASAPGSTEKKGKKKDQHQE